MVIGNLNSFGIEILLNEKSNKLVPLRLFINGNPLGTLDDATYFPNFIYKFESKLDSLVKLNTLDLSNDFDSLFDYIDSLENKFELYSLSLGESFDDYYIYIYVNSYKDVVVTWKIIDEPFFLYSNKELKGVFSCVVKVLEIKENLKKLREILNVKG